MKKLSKTLKKTKKSFLCFVPCIPNNTEAQNGPPATEGHTGHRDICEAEDAASTNVQLEAGDNAKDDFYVQNEARLRARQEKCCYIPAGASNVAEANRRLTDDGSPVEITRRQDVYFPSRVFYSVNGPGRKKNDCFRCGEIIAECLEEKDECSWRARYMTCGVCTRYAAEDKRIYLEKVNRLFCEDHVTRCNRPLSPLPPDVQYVLHDDCSVSSSSIKRIKNQQDCNINSTEMLCAENRQNVQTKGKQQHLRSCLCRHSVCDTHIFRCIILLCISLYCAHKFFSTV